MKYIYVKMTKEWGGFAVGDVVRFGYTKGERKIAEGFGVEVKKQKAVNDPIEEKPKEKPKIEVAVKEPVAIPKVETADITPKKKKDLPVKKTD